MIILLNVLLKINPIIGLLLGLIGAVFVFGLLGLMLNGISRLTNTKFTNRSGRVIIDNTKIKPLNQEQRNFISQLADIQKWEKEKDDKVLNRQNREEKLDEPLNKNEVVKNTTQTSNLINLLEAQKIINSKRHVSKEHLEKTIITQIVKVDSPTKFYNSLGEPIFQDLEKTIQMEKKLLYTELYSKLELERPSNKLILKAAFKHEKEQDYENASRLYKQYLTNIVLKVSVLSSNRYYLQLKTDTTICGSIKLVQTKSYEFLTMESSSVVLK